jgi:hypothetical protein
MRCPNVFDVAAAAWLTRYRYIRMVWTNLVAAKAGGVRHVVAHSDYWKPPRTREKRLVARFASLCEDSVRRRERAGGESDGTPRLRDGDPYDSSYKRNERELPLPQTDRRTLLEIVQVVALCDRL